MNRTTKRRYAAPASMALALTFALAACGGQQGSAGEGMSGAVKIDGSSTVEPLSSAASELYSEEQPEVQVTVGSSGTSGGFEAFCAGRTDISDASRRIEPEEEQVCKKAGIEYTELQVANDALTVVANKNVPVDCITTTQLKKIWGPSAEGKITNWKQVDPSFPDMPLKLFGPGTDSGTFDYFTEEINGEEGVSRADYEASEDDNVLVEGVANTPGALGYFGYTYYEENTDKLKALEVDSGNGCVAPSAETAQSGEYTPLARPLFIYVNEKSYSDKPQVASYVDFYVQNLQKITEAAKYIQLNGQQEQATQDALSGLGG
ncbi:MAG TPA: PstS family phosphate ABC transporter substrate-binding protein [Nocardioidaceae bacterium]|nr:PstS family phosphate ABC transporter substrate-binding protein [Nocardioidaceae bacterium]